MSNNSPSGPFGHLAECHGVADGGQRIAKLVGQHGQELVLLPVRLFHGVKQPGIVDRRGDALGEAFRQADLARRISAAGIAVHQADDANRLLADPQRNADHGMRAELADHFPVPVILARCCRETRSSVRSMSCGWPVFSASTDDAFEFQSSG